MRFSLIRSPEERAARRSVFREVPWRWRDVLIGLAPLLAARAVMAVISRIGSASLPAAPHWLWLPLSVLALAWMLIYTLWVMRRRQVALPPLPSFRVVLIEALIALLTAPLVMVGISVAFQVAASFLGPVPSPNAPLETLARSPQRFEVIGLVVLVVLVAPVAEESMFRGLLYNALRQRLPWLVAALLQAVAFGLLHPFELVGSFAVAVGGLSLALLYEWRRTLLAPVLLHAMINGVAMAVMVWGVAADANSPRLGVMGERHEAGCVITSIAPGSAAEEAGLRVGDVVTALDGERVADIQGMSRVVRRRRVGDRVTVELIRGGETYQIEVVLKGRRE